MARDTVEGDLRPTSILLGVLVDKAVFVVCALALAALLGISSPAFQSLALVCGLAATALGGFVAASHARRRYILHGVVVGAIAVAISFGRFTVNTIWPPEVAAGHPIWWELLGWAGALAAGTLGGVIVDIGARRSVTSIEPRSGEPRWGLWVPVLLALILLFSFAEQL